MVAAQLLIDGKTKLNFFNVVVLLWTNWALSFPLFNCTRGEELQSVGIKNPLKDKAVDYS